MAYMALSSAFKRDTDTHRPKDRQVFSPDNQTDRKTGVQTVRVNHKIVHSQRRKEKRRFNYFVYSILWRRKGTEGMNH